MATKSRSQQKKRKDATGTLGPAPLAEEVTTYEAHLPGSTDSRANLS